MRGVPVPTSPYNPPVLFSSPFQNYFPQFKKVFPYSWIENCPCIISYVFLTMSLQYSNYCFSALASFLSTHFGLFKWNIWVSQCFFTGIGLKNLFQMPKAENWLLCPCRGVSFPLKPWMSRSQKVEDTLRNTRNEK